MIASHVQCLHHADGDKLSKQNGAAALDLDDPVPAVVKALRHLGLNPDDGERSLPDWLAWGVTAWSHTYNPPP